MKKVIAVSSKGGHWIQMKRIMPAFEQNELYIISTMSSKPSIEYKIINYFSVSNAGRNSLVKLFIQACQVSYIIIKLRPHTVISTGASLGVWALLIGFLLGCKTIWLDSIANSEKISLSGRLVKPFVGFHLTQWPYLTKGKTKYIGNVL